MFEEIKKAQVEQKLRALINTGVIATPEEFAKSFTKDELAVADQDLIEKAVGHKYFKREGTPGNYKYYYTEAEYKEAKGGKGVSEPKKGEKFSHSKNGNIIFSHKIQGGKGDSDYYFNKEGKEQDLSKVVINEKDLNQLSKVATPNAEPKKRDLVTYEGKTYKRQENGKFMQVSEIGLTKKEHEFQSDIKKESASLANKDKKEFIRDTKLESSKLHQEAYLKLSSKEFDESELQPTLPKELKSKLEDLITDQPKGLYEKVAKHFGEPADDGESESALIDRIASHGEEKVKKFMDEVSGESKPESFENEITDFIHSLEDLIDNNKELGKTEIQKITYKIDNFYKLAKTNEEKKKVSYSRQLMNDLNY